MTDCIHEWQHFKFIDNTTTRFDPRKSFTLAYYCRKCLVVTKQTYPPLKDPSEPEPKKERNVGGNVK